MCFTKPVLTASSSAPSPTWQTGIRKGDDGWTARGPGIWTDEEFDSSDDDLEAAPAKPLQKKPLHVIRKERAEIALKRAVGVDKTPFIVQKQRSPTVPKNEAPAVHIVQKKRFAEPQTPVVLKKVRDIVYSRSTLMQIRSRFSNASQKRALPDSIATSVSRPGSSAQLNEEEKLRVKKAQAKMFLRAISDIRACA